MAANRSVSGVTANTETLESYTITNQDSSFIIKPGDNVSMLSHYYRNKPNCIAKIEKILPGDGRFYPRVKILWFYRPEDAIGGRTSFHGSKELFFSDHMDTKAVDTIVEKCNVYSIDDYKNLDKVEENDFFCRFEYQHLTGAFNPESVNVYCSCDMPENPDIQMIVCENCDDRFHPACVNMTAKMAKQLNHFICQPCLSAMEVPFGRNQP